MAPSLDIVAWCGDDGGSGYGLGATAPIPSGTPLVSIPTHAQLTYDDQHTPAPLMRLINQVPEELWGAKLALQLLAQRAQGEQSMWSPYIRNLPVGFQGVGTCTSYNLTFLLLGVLVIGMIERDVDLISFLVLFSLFSLFSLLLAAFTVPPGAHVFCWR